MPARNRPTGSNKPDQTQFGGLPSRSTPNLPTWRSLKIGGHPRSEIPSKSTFESIEDADSTPTGSGGPNESNGSREPSLLLSGASDDDDSTNEDQIPTTTAPQSHPSLSSTTTTTTPLPPPLRPKILPHSRSHTHLIGPSTFAPPFYNRPPTPLPPSPSLTSLLRPAFSSASRPSTPDLSSDEAVNASASALPSGAQTPTSALPRQTSTVPRASPQVPTYEYYGFTLYLTSSLAFIVYVLWAFLPSPLLHSLGIYYYPNRWWALAIPAWMVMGVVYIYVALACYNVGTLTLGVGDLGGFVDEAGVVAVVDSEGRIVRRGGPSWGRGEGKEGVGRRGEPLKQQRREGRREGELDWRLLWREGTDAVMDIPIGGVCEILYGGGEEDEEGVGGYDEVEGGDGEGGFE